MLVRENRYEAIGNCGRYVGPRNRMDRPKGRDPATDTFPPKPLVQNLRIPTYKAGLPNGPIPQREKRRRAMTPAAG